MARPTGHNNVAAVGYEVPSTLRNGDRGTEVTYLQNNLNEFADNSLYWECNLSKNVGVDGIFGTGTETAFKKVQSCLDLYPDGVYGVKSRNKFHKLIGVSPKGFDRLYNSTGYINYNDENSGFEPLDHSWFTQTTRSTIQDIGKSWSSYYSTPLEINDGSLIKGEDTPDHNTHQGGKDIDVRDAGFNNTMERRFLKIASAHPNVSKILYHQHSDIDKVQEDSAHSTHFHVDTLQ